MALSYKRLPNDSYPGALGETRRESSTTGTALTTTATLINILPGTTHLSIVSTTFAGGANVAKFSINPYLLVLTTLDSGKTWSDASATAQGTEGGRALILDALTPPSMSGGYVYIGSHLPFRGVAFTSNEANAVVSTLTGNYWNGTKWVSLGITDGTASGGATFAITGNITWTVPSAWTQTRLPFTWGGQFPSPISGWLVQPNSGSPVVPIPPGNAAQLAPYCEKKRYWAQFTVSATLTSPTSGSLLLPLNRSTNYSEHIGGDYTQLRVFKGPDGISCIEALTDTGTASLDVNGYVDAVVGAF